MKKIIFLFTILFSVCTFNANAQFKDLIKKAKQSVTGEDNTGLGLKEALNFGVDQAVKTLSAENGYLDSKYKVLIPEDAQKIVSTVKKVPGFENVEQTLIEKMNKAAELAAKEATPIFGGAIKRMTFKDATNILMGNDDEATRYLETNTRPELTAAFLPIIQKCLDEVNARTYWKTVMDAYNTIPFVKKMNPELDQHVNNKGLDGLFALIQVKEEGIRNDVNQRTSPLLKEVFAKTKK
jgi:hypothetical protein